MPSTTAASFAFSFGTIIFLIPKFFASILIGRIPFTLFTLPSSESSPTNTVSSIFFSDISPKLINIPIAIGRSKNEPSFLVFAGAKFTTIFLL